MTMKKTLTAALAITLLAGTGAAFAQDRNDRNRYTPPVTNQQRFDNQRFDDHNNRPMDMRGGAMDRHPDWRQGGHIARNDWGRGRHVDFRAHHLRQPPRGYEWRQVDNNYVLAAVASGLIASIILANH